MKDVNLNITQKEIPFAKPNFSEIDLKEIKERIDKTLRSGWLTSGPVVKEFEEKFASYIGTKHAVAVNSCTAALHASLLALGIKRGDEVIVPSNTFVATANSALYVGAKPVFADSDPGTFNISAEAVNEKINSKTKAIIVVHLAGNPCDINELSEIAKDNNISLIEDCAHAHGAKYKEKCCGTLGKTGCFSFYATKVMTSAEGGMVTTNDEALASKIKVIRNAGRAAYGPTAIQELGYNFRLTDVNAVIGIVQLNHLTEYVMSRNVVAKTYTNLLSEVDWLKPQIVREGNLSSYYAYIVELADNAPLARDELAVKLKQKGIGTSVLYHPVHLQPIYIKLFGFSKGVCPVSERLGEQSIALPLDNNLSVEDGKYVVETIKQIVEETKV